MSIDLLKMDLVLILLKTAGSLTSSTALLQKLI